MSGELHEISAKIGGLEAKADGAEKSRVVLYDKLDDISKSLSVMESQSARALAEIASLRKEMAEIRPEIETWRAMRNKALGGLLVVGFLFSAGGAAAWAAFTKFMHGQG